MFRLVNRSHSRSARGFTLLEMMLVVLIIGMVVTLGVVALVARLNAARKGTTIVSLNTIKSQLTQYQMDYAAYPETLEALKGKYLEKIPLDGWKKPFVYIYPGTSGDSTRPYDLYSTGGAEPGAANSEKIDVWTAEP